MKEDKQKIIKDFSLSNNDVGSTEVQVALLNDRIKKITQHLKTNKKDFSSTRGLVSLVSKRKKLLSYLSKKKPDSFLNLKKKLNIR